MKNVALAFMYSFLLSIIFSLICIGILIINYRLKNDKEDFEKLKREVKLKDNLFPIGIIYSLIFFVTVLFVTLTVKLNVNRVNTINSNVVEETEKEIVSLNIKNNINGEAKGFFVGIGGVNGNISEEEYYYFYTKNNNRYKLEKVSADNVELIEDEGTPKIVYKKVNETKSVKVTTGNFSKFLGFNFDDEYELNYGAVEKEEILIYIPPNSILSNFDVNLE